MSSNLKDFDLNVKVSKANEQASGNLYITPATPAIVTGIAAGLTSVGSNGTEDGKCSMRRC